MRSKNDIPNAGPVVNGDANFSYGSMMAKAVTRHTVSHPTVLPAIVWTGGNLETVIDFLGSKELWKNWFSSWEEYECAVKSSGNILKIFTQDMQFCYICPEGTWIIRTPEGRAFPVGITPVRRSAQRNENM